MNGPGFGKNRIGDILARKLWDHEALKLDLKM